MAFQKVTREKSKLRLALAGPSGAGKTLSALLLAYGITNDWSKIALIDTEHGRAKFYANRSDFGTGEFLYQEMSAPYSPDKYISMVNEGADAVGADGVVIVHSFSPCWDNEGGVLDIKSQIAEQPKKNDYS
ncbi:MAG: ATP-binding protein, partial [Ruminococcus sp.]|nr:ATP-binding protein [Ruminococcus sp.]